MKTKNDNSFPELQAFSVTQLKRLRTKIDEEIAHRSVPVRMVDAELTIDAGNRRAGAKCWVKEVSGIDPSREGGWGFAGKFLPEQDRFNKSDARTFIIRRNEKTLLVASGTGGSYKNTTTAHVVLRVKKGAKTEYSSVYQKFSGIEVELLEHKRIPEAILKLYPELAPVKADWFEVYAILRSSGIALTKVPMAGPPTPVV
jgi:hypothetical protein